jgi:cysteinyl-tRNA synthetase
MQYIYNSYSKQKELFQPISATSVSKTVNENSLSNANQKESLSNSNSHKRLRIKIYVCGQTVYDYCHIGHARKAIVFDMVRRWFIANGYEVIFVENITDIDDKIINRADENNESIHELTNRFINAMNRDFALLNILPATYAPKATEYIPQMIFMIQELINKEHAYIADNGDVYFSVRKFKNYGHLSGKNIEDLNAGERVSVNEVKHDPLDFVLWKSTTEQKNREAVWDAKHYGASFGEGRPGWHIECSAMANSILGAQFDIHGGGQDLMFPHHENEIAQSESCNDCRFANYWMHNGFITIKDDKMSKSLGNFVLIHDLLQDYHAEVIRYFMLKTHYRSPLNYTTYSLQEAKEVMDRMYHNLSKYIDLKTVTMKAENDNLLHENYAEFKELRNKFITAMQDDFNTPLAIMVLHEGLNLLNDFNNTNPQQTTPLLQLLLAMAQSLGLWLTSPSEYLSFGATLTEKEITDLIAERKQAKINKDYAKSDEIRKHLQNKNIELKDNQDGTTYWYVS